MKRPAAVYSVIFWESIMFEGCYTSVDWIELSLDPIIPKFTSDRELLLTDSFRLLEKSDTVTAAFPSTTGWQLDMNTGIEEEE